jgi:hypothetical protein
MPDAVTQVELEAYLDEALPPDEMARIETAVRSNAELLERLATANARRDVGLHSLGEIWRRRRLTCLPREQLGGYLLGTLPGPLSEYVRFHVETAGCRYCQANLHDLRAKQGEAAEAVENRRRKYFQSSAGYLRK